MSKLFEAHKQWRERPADERFSSLRELHETVLARREASVASRVRLNELRFSVEPNARDIVLDGAQSVALPSHWAFGQLCDYLDLPAAHERKLPAQLVTQELNWAVGNSPRQELMMLWANGAVPGIVRCFTTPSYGRLWDSDVLTWLRDVTDDESNGWHRPPAMTDDEYPSGIYGGDRNIFAFLVNESNRIEDGSVGGLSRGFFCWNSEVKQKSFGFRAFLYRHVCGNHIVWGAEELFNLRMIHLGEGMSQRAAREFGRVIQGYLNTSTEADQAVVNKARSTSVAPTAEQAIQFLSARKVGFNLKEATEIVSGAQLAGEDPTNVWALVNAATSLSQKKFSWADERNNFDSKSSKLLEVVF